MQEGPPISFLDVEDVTTIHQNQVRLFGGDAGILSMALLESAVGMPQQAAFGDYLHAYPFEMAAAYLFHLARNHAFADGNKRVGTDAAVVFLKINGITVDADPDELAELTLAVVTGNLDKGAVAAFLQERAEQN